MLNNCLPENKKGKSILFVIKNFLIICASKPSFVLFNFKQTKQGIYYFINAEL